MRARLPSLIALLPALAACSSLSRFSTAPGESYCGVVTGAAFVRSDALAEGTAMRLSLDVDALESQPGLLWTGDLAPSEHLSATPVRAIKQLPADPLSTLSFGEGSVQSTIGLAELGHTELTVVISMMQSGDVDVRLLRGDGSTAWVDGAAKPPQIFGVFHLKKAQGDCGLK